MPINLEPPNITELKPRICVVGIGGAGGNAINNMIASNLDGVNFVVANTDAQALAMSSAEHCIQLGINLTEGLGAGAKPEIGEAAAQEALDEIKTQLSGAHMVFVAAGMGGGTGTGAAPVIARASRELGILTVGVVSKPFLFEGARRMRMAEAGIAELSKNVDTLIVIPNQNLFRLANERTTFAEAFKLADEVLHAGVACVTDLIVREGLINLDFADVKAVMLDMGNALMGTGEASGENRAIQAAELAISNPLLDNVSMKGAKGLLVSIVGSHELTLYEFDEAANRIRKEVDPNANIIVGATYDDSLGDKIRVSIVASGLTEAGEHVPTAPATATASTGAGHKVAPSQAASSGGATPVAAPSGPGLGGAKTSPSKSASPSTSPAGPASVTTTTGTTTSKSPAKPSGPPAPALEEDDIVALAAEDEIATPEDTANLAGKSAGKSADKSADKAPGWTSPGGVKIEPGPPVFAPRTPSAPKSSSGPVRGDGSSHPPEFRPAPPHEARRETPRIPSLEDFPTVGQRDYNAKKVGAQGGGEDGGKKQSLFGRLAALNFRQNESSDAPTQDPAGNGRWPESSDKGLSATPGGEASGRPVQDGQHPRAVGPQQRNRGEDTKRGESPASQAAEFNDEIQRKA